MKISIIFIMKIGNNLHFAFILAFALALFAPTVRAHDTDGKHSHNVTYVANMSGIDCAACKKTIARSIGKLKGVKTIRIVKISETSHRLFVETDGSKSISMGDAKKALGKNVEHYKINSWSKS